ncbi:excalibur calcium-binding domain-containing protein [Microbacterium oleivorans]|uniref:Excalibur calcium-binding domain protein n=2 Tax=Microbacterium oleivorans TaxID=273677 RepID=A0A031FYE0_9MICO|nr:excalibur calcium-binding domain-containing protein [Microbacterium oleivorans]EZP29879.1 Excalibur calcium-binding domain protein [Microbacterium oleivorans]
MKVSVRTGVQRTMMVVLVAGALAIAPAGSASAAPTHSASVSASRVAPAAKPVIKTFANCTAMHKVYKGGVAKSGVKYNKVNGKNKAFKIKPAISTALYNANKKMDRDKDGIACEKG